MGDAQNGFLIDKQKSCVGKFYHAYDGDDIAHIKNNYLKCHVILDASDQLCETETIY